MQTVLYSLESYGKTLQQAAEAFATNFFVERREVETLNGDQFRLVDGLATYQIVTVKPVKNISVGRYDIIRLRG